MAEESDRPRGKPRGFAEAMRWYGTNARMLGKSWEAIDPREVHDWLLPHLPSDPSLILDIGAGTGRDAAWLASLGHRIIAVEPSAELRGLAQEIHTSPSIQWVDDQLPGLEVIHRYGLSFDLILLSAVWMHIAADVRGRAFRKLITLLKPGGALAISLRHGPVDEERSMFPVSQSEIEDLARQHGAFVQSVTQTADKLGRADVSWTQLLIRLPDDGTGALPFLRHVILNDDKASTYKLALLRTLCRIADGSAGFAREADDNHIAIPLGIVGLYWLRLFKPLLTSNLPQTPTNQGLNGLGFVKEGFRRLQGLSSMDLRPGVQFTRDRSAALHQALGDACRTVASMPATFIKFPNGMAAFPTRRGGRISQPSLVTLDEGYLSTFGVFLVPNHLWFAFQRFGAWIEPALVFEWSRLIRRYAQRQGQKVDEGSIAAAMQWSDPRRDVQLAKARAQELLSVGKLHCVWSGRLLTRQNLDIDHCIPWSAWPCEDLWNLVPTSRSVNQRLKRDRLPSADLLRTARARIEDWWSSGYLNGILPSLKGRFFIEAKASLPIASDTAGIEQVSFGLEFLQRRIHRDQQVSVWDG